MTFMEQHHGFCIFNDTHTESANICQGSDILSRKLVKLIIVRVCNLTFETSVFQRGIFIQINTHIYIAEWAHT